MGQQQPDSYLLPPAPPSRLGVLGLRDFRLLWTGQTVSAIGDQIYPIAVALKVVHAGGSAADLGLVLLGRAAAMVVFLVLAGVWADRMPRTRMMVGADVVRAVAVLGLALSPRHVPVLLLTLLTFVVGGGEAFFRPAYGAVVPSVVPAERLERANALTSISLKTSMLLGPALGGLLVAVAGPGWALGVDAATFLVSMATLVRIREPEPVARGPRQPMLREALEGVAAVRERAWVGAILVMATLQLMVAVAPAIVLEPFIARQRLGGDGAYGALLVVFALGGLAGAFATARVTVRRPGLWALAGVLPYAAFLLGLAFTSSLALMLALSCLAGLGLEPFQIWWSSALQREIPPELLARVVSLDWLVSLGLMPVGFALTGPAVAAFGRTTVLVAGAVVIVVTTLGVLPVRGVAEFATPQSSPG